ncbi:MAG: double-strand break repair protein AddB [Pelagibacterium sp. SCN 64-44]|mgnify:CR=1 FL=1|nr:MAG: double-strand break repair protein AddB [Pelagibacterium sp. SCN 64-44]
MRLFSIAPSTPFLPCLAAAVMDGRLLAGWDRAGPFWLGDVTLLVPTQRARQKLAEAFAVHPDFTGLLPDIRTFGGEEADEEPFLPPFDAPALPLAASTTRRRLTLSRLVAQWAHSPRGRLAFSTPPGAAEIFSMAAALGQLIDDLHIEERSPADIRTLGAEMAPDLGEYWQQTLEFLDIALHLWPEILAAEGLADPAALRGARLDRQALAATHLFGDRPVIAAGSTGSIPATARLLAAIARLPRGAVVLPGLDLDLTPQSLATLEDAETNPHGHPQYGLAHLLRVLGTGVEAVTELCAAPHPRTRLVNRALAPSGETARWSAQRFDAAALAAALDGVAIIRARNEDEEARAVALAARAALENGDSVGIVTSDRNLARRIAAELRRFAIRVDDAAGTPLFQSAAGRLARQALALAAGNFAPLDLMALLRNRAVTLGQDRAALAETANSLDLVMLRGQRPGAGLSGLRQLLAALMQEQPRRRRRALAAETAAPIAALFDRLEAALAPITALLDLPDMDAAALAAALWRSVDSLSAGAPLQGREELGRWAEEMAGLAGQGHRFAPFGLDAVLAALMSGFEARNHEQRRDDIAIWGQIEARLMSPDLLILAALNEDKWPGPADPGPWLSRGMRLKAGLEPPERQQGLAAHDFAQGMGNARVLVAYAERIGASPALPSRLVQRLDAFIGAAEAEMLRERGRTWLEAARRLDAVETVRPAARPAPNPPLAARPRRLSVTEIETLMRSPYDLYAKHVLRLRPLDALGEDPDARERGTIIHAIFARFVNEGHDMLAEAAFERLMEIARTEFAGLDMIGERRDIWLRRFAMAAAQFLDFERQRDGRVRRRHAEIRGEWTLPLAEAVLITGEADRVDELTDGSLEILDFKTGSPPGSASMKAFEAPQLPLEALMARAGAMPPVAPADASALTYIKIGLGPDAFKPSAFAVPEGMELMEAADAVSRLMQGHIEHFLLRETPLPARLLPLKTQRFAGPYDHLARVAEWLAIDGEEEA